MQAVDRVEKLRQTECDSDRTMSAIFRLKGDVQECTLPGITSGKYPNVKLALDPQNE